MPTPTDSSLRTGWVAIATEGESIDGRLITAQWITDMAETYDPEFYCAQLWPEHIHYAENMGHVQALKSDTVDGKMTLFAVLSPTRDLIYSNSRGQMKFCSIEPWENFAGTGKTYLFGLGVTDLPASTGTTMLKFSATRFDGEPLDLYRKRVKWAYFNARDAGDVAGFKRIFERLGLGWCELHERQADTDWDVITVEVTDSDAANNQALMMELIQHYGRTCRRYRFQVVYPQSATVHAARIDMSQQVFGASLSRTS